jgi:deoxyribonuclease V
MIGCAPARVSFAEARALQEGLRGQVVERDAFGEIRRVAGADVSYDRGSPELFAAVVVLDAETLELVEASGVRATARFPYVPGYLSFRELPAVLEAFGRLRALPDLVLCDGQGRAHPRRFGLACHLGVLLDLPSIGCAKSRLVGTHREPGARRGSHVRLLDEGEVIGEVVRTREAVKPIYVSIGHRVSLATARKLALRFARKHRVPEPVRAAHAEVNRLRAEARGHAVELPEARSAPRQSPGPISRPE